MIAKIGPREPVHLYLVNRKAKLLRIPRQITVNIFYFSFRTPFGTQEYEVSCHTYLDSHRAEQDVNHFMIMMGVPGDDVYPVAN